MTWAEGFYASMYGRIYSKWSLEKDLLRYNAIVPPNTSATLFLPARSIDLVMENGIPAAEAEGIKFLRFENGKAVLSLEPGQYTFQTEL
jgi:alpha-L-rhamnosidase